MRDGTVALPYSTKALRALARTLKIHRDLLWLDPTTNSLALKHISNQEEMQDAKS